MSERPYYDKEFFPDGENYDDREKTVFLRDFLLAERFGYLAVKDTFRRAFGEWKDNCKYLLELCVVMNHLCWRAHANNDSRMMSMYREYYNKCYGYAFSDEAGFTKEERSFFYGVIN